MSFVINKNDGVLIHISENESDAVKIAAKNLSADLKKVICAREGHDAEIVIGTLGVSEFISEYVSESELCTDGIRHKETYLHKIADNKLIIAGTDRRGTIYGIYEFCENIGVSPWYFFADVPIKTRDRIELGDSYFKKDYPTVEYRGIFINDEEELDNWVKLNMGEDTISVKTYEKIFELLLRLKANYIWPAMHVNSFNMRPENGALAEKMGIVVGTSHCDMLMRSNNREWKPWLEKKGYEGAEYDYSQEGRNRDILKEYWRESVEQNKDFEVSYTLGMRGVHDSGFEVKAFENLEGEELLKAKINLLETVISDQEEMLRDVLDYTPMKTFVPYKEVLNLYDSGLKVPEDLTLIWSNDNYGYIRRYPGEKERKRKGGNGIYYHNSYWAPPGASYLFICSIPLSHTKNELRKAYNEGIQKLWVLNVGAIKPLEAEIEFFLRYAWEITKETTTHDTNAYMEQWINKNFSGRHGGRCAEIFNEFDQIVNVRKIEHMENDVFSCSAYGDEWTDRVNRLKRIYDEGNEIYNLLPDEEKEAFYQLVLMKLHAGYFTNMQYYYADRSKYASERGMLNTAKRYTEYSIRFDDEKRRLIEYYNHIMCNGKWNGILTPEKFPPPVTAMHPICVPPVEIPKKSDAIISVWNDEDSIAFVKPSVKWVDIAPSGQESINYTITAPEWVKLSQTEGTAGVCDRILVEVKEDVGRVSDVIRITAGNTVKEIPITADFDAGDCNNIEDGGIIAVAADTGVGGWKKISRLGRNGGSLMEAEKKNETLSYKVYITSDCTEPLLEIHRFPSLNSTGQIRVGVSVDGVKTAIVETVSNDEWRGNWKNNILDNVDKLYLKLPRMIRGVHTIEFTSIDKYFAFSKFAIYTSMRRENNLAAPLCDSFMLPTLFEGYKPYDNIELLPRPTVYAYKNPTGDTLVATGTKLQDNAYAEKTDIKEIIYSGKTMFEEVNGSIKIDAAAALADTEFARFKGAEWSFCNSESHGRSSIAMYYGGKSETVTKEEAPRLNYKIKTKNGVYTVWLLTKITRRGDDYIAVSVDGEYTDKLYGGNGKLWRYEAEQIWRWVPAAEIELKEGIHDLSICSRTKGIRFDRIYITSGEELPPTDLNW